METTKLYLLAPHHDIPADGPLVLGSIISDLRDPDSLNKNAIVPIAQRDIQTSHKYDWQYTTETSRGGCLNVCARYLSSFFNSTLGGNSNDNSVVRYHFRDLETTYFTPDLSYVKKAVNKHKVHTYLEFASFTPVYMITGLKIGRGPDSQIAAANSHGIEGHGRTGISTSAAGFPFTVDSGDVTLRQSGVKEASFRGSSDFVVAYRLVKVTFHKNADGSHAPSYDKYAAGAMLGETAMAEKEDAKVYPEVRVDGDKVLLEELGEEDLITAIDEEDNQECRCFIVPRADSEFN